MTQEEIKKQTFEKIQGVVSKRVHKKEQLGKGARLYSHPADYFEGWTEDQIWNEYIKVQEKKSNLPLRYRQFLQDTVVLIILQHVEPEEKATDSSSSL